MAHVKDVYLAVRDAILILPHVQNVMMDIFWQLMDYLAYNVRMMFQAVKYVRLQLHVHSVFLDILR